MLEESSLPMAMRGVSPAKPQKPIGRIPLIDG